MKEMSEVYYGKFKDNNIQIQRISRLYQTNNNTPLCQSVICRKSSTTTCIHQSNVRNYCTEHIYKLYPNSWLYWTYPTMILCLQTKKISPDLMRWFVEKYFPIDEFYWKNDNNFKKFKK